MSEAIIADFVGKFNAEVMTRAEPVPGRVLLSEKRLVLAAREDDKLTIPLSTVFDVAVGHVPSGLGDFFDSTVTVAFERGGERHVAAIEAEDGKISKFSTVLFRAILGGSEATVVDRARVAGRVTRAAFSSATVSLAPGTAEFRRSGGTTSVSLDAVVGFRRGSHERDGSVRQSLSVDHFVDDEAVTTTIAMAPRRKMAVLGRFLRLEYSDLLQDLRDVELGTDERRLALAMYSLEGFDGESLARVLDVDETRVQSLVRTLDDAGLVETTGSEPTLTRTGQVVATRPIDGS